MNSYESVSNETKNFVNELNKLLREKGFYIDFHNGNLYSTTEGYVGALDDEIKCLALIEEDTGEILYESKKND